MEIFSEVTLTHCPAVGEKVKLKLPAVVVEIVDGLHEPLIPFVELVGKFGGVAATQIGVIGVKVGVTIELITTSIVALDEHVLFTGIKV